MKLLINIIIALSSASLMASAKNATSPSETPEALYAEVGPDFVVLTVDKKALRAELKIVPERLEKSRTLQSFTIAIGKELGDKFLEGDNKTPEGIYFTQSVIDGATLPAKYGPFAIPIDYPNPIDRSLGKTGYGIWLHGVIKDERVEEANVTEGCVAFYNADIIKLTRWLKPYQGVVIIADDTKEVNNPSDLAAVREATQAWSSAWAARDIDKYASFYADDFVYGAHDKSSYRSYKQRVFNSYKVMKVVIDNLRVVTHPKYAVAIMDQDFFGDDRFTSIGRKILYWEKTKKGFWRIMREVYENRRLEFVKFSQEKEENGTQAAVAHPDQDDVPSKL